MMVIGSPRGALLLSFTSVPGMQPISSSLSDISASFRQQIVPFSPIFRSLTLRCLFCTLFLFRLFTNNCKLLGVPCYSKICFLILYLPGAGYSCQFRLCVQVLCRFLSPRSCRQVPRPLLSR